MSKEGEVLNDLSDEEIKVDDVSETEPKEVVKSSKNKKKDKKKEVAPEPAKEVELKEEEPIAIKDEEASESIDVDKEEVKDDKEDKEDDAPPPKPLRPLTPKQEAHKNLKEAFPSVEEKVITTVLIASNYQLEPAFNSLLYYSDPDSVSVEDLLQSQAVTSSITQPTLPSRPSQSQSQYEQDELLAKQLSEEFNRKEARRSERRRRKASEPGNNNTYLDDGDSDVFTNFVEKDLPQIKDQVSKNFEETKNKFNTWIGGWKKTYQEQQDTKNQLDQQRTSRRRQQVGTTNNQFDDEPEEVDLQKIHGISLNDNSQNKDDELYSATSNTKSKKWEPLKGAKPEPISKSSDKPTTDSSTDHGVVDDDFLLSDDEDLVKK